MIKFLENVLLKDYTTFKVGGPCRKFIEIYPENYQEELSEVINSEKKYFFLGNGSNLLVPDEGYDGTIIHVQCPDCTKFSMENNSITAPGFVSLSKLCNFAMENGLGGLEWAYGIPGTIGGAVYMNAGAYIGQMSDVVEEVQIHSGEIFEHSDCEFSYRHSVFMEKNGIIVSVKISNLLPKNPEDIKTKMSEFMKRRRDKQPLEYPSAGSFFKRIVTENDTPVYAAKLIEDCGCKGMRVGNAAVSEKHSGFIVNLGGATFTDIMKLASQVQETVKEKTGYILELEPEILR